MRISDWSSDVCSSDLRVKPNSAKAKTVSAAPPPPPTVRKKLSYKDQRDYDMLPGRIEAIEKEMAEIESDLSDGGLFTRDHARFTALTGRSEEHTSELQSLMRISYAVFCLKKKMHSLSLTTK